MAPDSSTLAWKIPWTEEPGGLLSMGGQGPHLAMTGEPRGVSGVVAGFARPLYPWDFPGKSTGVGYHCLLCSNPTAQLLFSTEFSY